MGFFLEEVMVISVFPCAKLASENIHGFFFLKPEMHNFPEKIKHFNAALLLLPLPSLSLPIRNFYDASVFLLVPVTP